MTFEGFFSETYQFLLNLSANNNKIWFEERRDEYNYLVRNPFLALEEAIRPFILDLDPRLRTGPLALSRVYRDTRFSKDKSPLRDHLWLGYKPPKIRTSEFFGLFVCITPVGYEFGMGMYAPMTACMQHIREKILASPPTFLSIANDSALNQQFILESQPYMRPRYEHKNPIIAQWLNMKGFTYLFTSGDIAQTMSASFIKETLHAFQILAPMYRFVHDLSD